MPLNKETWTAIGIGSAVVLVSVAIFGLTRPPTPIPSVQPWNNKPIRAIQGIAITISLPRGESFIVASPDVRIQAQVQRGNESHLVIVPLIVDEPTYTLETVIVEQGSGRTYPIVLRAQPIQTYVEAAGGVPR
jgi:hypothetical protein